MSQASRYETVELAVHKDILKYFHAEPFFEKHTISECIIPEYNIVILEDVDSMEIVPIVQQFIPFIKVLMPVALDEKIKEHFADYDLQDLSKYLPKA